LRFGDDGALGGFFAGITGHEPAGDGGGLPGGEGEAVVAEELHGGEGEAVVPEELRGEQLLGAEGHLILHEAVLVLVVGVDVGAMVRSESSPRKYRRSLLRAGPSSSSSSAEAAPPPPAGDHMTRWQGLHGGRVGGWGWRCRRE